MKTYTKLFTALFWIILQSNLSFAQNNAKSSFGKGVNFTAPDSSFSIKFGVRFQSLFIAEKLLNETSSKIESEYLIRRARLKFDGFAYHPNLTYKMEFGLTNRDMGKPIAETGNAPGIILDAVLKWKVAKGLSIWFGQTKLPGNRERVISSQAFQLVDRSIVNSEFNIDRDAGIQVHHSFKIANVVFNEMASVSQGEGRNITVGNKGGYDYTGRVEILPFGNFTNKGDYFGSDLEREETPKLSLAGGYDFNDDASREQGQLGKFLPGTADLSTIMADMMFKYSGFSVMAEYMDKQTDNPVLTDTSGSVLGTFITGTGINAQVGYLFKNNIELAGRYSEVTPSKETGSNQITQYTFGISKYIKGHSLKVQSDVSLTQEEGIDDQELMFRFQVEMAF